MKKPLNEFLLGGPGHDGYAYQADVVCVECGQAIIENLYERHYKKLLSEDTEDSPQPIFFGDSPDCAQHCSRCGEYLYGENILDEDDDVIKINDEEEL